MQQNRNLITLFLALVLATSNLFSQTNSIPAEAKGKTSPFLFSQETAKTGEQVYNANCKSCHGDPGKGNYAKLNPIPKDPASEEYQKNTDGEMFYILSNGKGTLMPTFVNTLSEEQRWQVISFIRSFNKNYKQPPIKTLGEAVKTETAKMLLAYDLVKKVVFATVTDSVKDSRKPLPDVSIKLFVKRTFGNLLVSEATTGKDGIAYFNIPNDIPGDSTGTLFLIAKTQGNSKELTGTLKEKVGVITIPKQLLSQRTWWNVNKMAPTWLILLYLSGVVGVGVTVLYILMQLRKIKKINDSK